MGDTIKRTWIIVHEPGLIPDTKGPFLDEDKADKFLRDLIACRPIGTTYTVARLTWNDELWVESGDERLWIDDAAPLKARRLDPLAGLRIQVRHRLHAAVRHLRNTGTLNRADVQRIGEVSVPQASADINLIKQRFPGLMAYDASAKCYRLADRPTSGDTHGN